MRRPLPRARARPRVRASAVALAATLTVAAGAALAPPSPAAASPPSLAQAPPAAPAPAPPPPAAAGEPVIIIPGWLETPAMMELLRSRFEAAGHPAYVVDLAGIFGVPSTNSTRNVSRVLVAVQWARLLNGAERVTLVGVSYGGVLARHYLRSLDGLPYVRNHVALGTPERGVAVTCGLPYEETGHLCPGSEFIAALNAGDDTPGDVRYASIRSDQDDPALTALDGEVCRVYVPGVPHLALQDSEAVFAAALAHVRGEPCPDLFTGTVAS